MSRTLTLIFFLFTIAVLNIEAQNHYANSPWKERNHYGSFLGKNKTDLSVSKFRLYQLNAAYLEQSLKKLKWAGRNDAANVVIPFPSADGYMRRFRVQVSNTLHPDLAKKFPNIKTYEGVGLDDPTAIIRFEISPKGLTAMLWSANSGTEVIQPHPSNQDEYLIYYKKAASRNKATAFKCSADHIHQPEVSNNNVHKSRNNDGQLRTYRLALATTGEYTAFHGGTKQSALTAAVITINRVNGILKRDVAVELQIISNNDLIIFTNAALDGYTNNDGGEMLSENQTILDAIIGTNNYDIGHVFSTGGGGVAFLSSVCSSTTKAGGVTGSQFPQGNPFDVDFVAHEIGHQLGATHTQNNDCNNSNASAFEPGSGSTIMGYAGICFPNVQINSDPYYHSISIEQIKGRTTGPSDGCAIKTATNNQAPSVSTAANYTIPHSTPFELEGQASDPNNDALTYTWEQMDNEIAPMPPRDSSDKGPMFRSLLPNNSPIRQFPKKDANNNHTSSMWEVLPRVGRSLNFRLTVRDNNINGGCTATSETEVIVAGNAGPFKILSPNGGEQIAAGINQQITWDVARSNEAPVNAQNVDIFLSTDGGNTYPIILLENTPNDGAQEVIFQNSMVTSNARIKIKASDNVFFDVSDNNFEIVESQPGFILMVDSENKVECPLNSLQYTILVEGVDNFDDNVTLSVEMPAELDDFSLQTNIVSVGNSTNLVINIGNQTAAGTYPIKVTGTSGSIQVSKILYLTVLPANISTVTLLEPANAQSEIIPNPAFSWAAIAGVSNYILEVSDNANFSSLLYSNNDLTGTTDTLPFNLESGQIFYWRVRANNACGTSDNSVVFSFTVSNVLCSERNNNQEIFIPKETRSTISSPIIFTENGTVTGIKVSFDISHSWMEDLSLTLESPSGKRAKILSEICGNEDQMNLTFANEGFAHNIIPCEPPIVTNPDSIFLPLETFDIFNGEEANGTWKLLVTDDYVLDGGTLNAWNIEICREVSEQAPLEVLISNTINPSCNGGSDGSIMATIIGGQPNYTVLWSNNSNQLSLNNLKAGAYAVTVTDGNGTQVFANTTLTEPTAISLDNIIQDATCNGVNNGSIQVFPSGGTPTYTYQWANGVRQSSNLNLPDGNYEVTVTDKNGCTYSETYGVEEPAAIQISASSNNAINGLNGSIDITVSGGTPPYTYSWSNGAPTEDLNSLSPGNYSVTITDKNACTASKEITVATENTGQDCYNVTINITLDNYGEENRWELRNGNGVIIEQVGPFNNFENGATKTTNLCLPPGCYDFTIFDLWGDGMCCSYGQGKYEVIEDATQKVLAQGGSFNKEETTTICVPSSVVGTIIDYCGANGRNTQYEWIETIEIEGQVFNSGNNEGYGDFSDTEVDVPIGGILNLAFTPGFGFFQYSENWQIWIDFNSDGDFEDEGEAVFLTSGNERVTGEIGIPNTAKPGKTRMRIAMKWGELIEPCESFSWGEVEDYTLVLKTAEEIGAKNLVNADNRVFQTGAPHSYTQQQRTQSNGLLLSPNPATKFINLEWKDSAINDYTLSIYNMLGQIKTKQVIKSNEGLNRFNIAIDNFPNGIYLLTFRHKSKMITKEFVVSRRNK